MRAKPRIRALVLAAGLGTRLQPLTARVPKALLPVAGRPVAAGTLKRLAAAGCEAAALNLHHLGEQIRAAFGDRFEGMPLAYSPEAELLGTLGALAPLKGFLREADVVVVINGDSLCRWPLKRLVRRHLAGGARATLLLARRADPQRYGGGVGVDAKGRIVSFRPGGQSIAPAQHRHVFAGVHVFSPELVSSLTARPSDLVRDLYEPLLAVGSPLQAVITGRRWHDLGTPRRYLEGLLDWVLRPWPGRRSWVSPQAVVERGARVRHSLVEAGARVAAGATVEGAVMLPGAHLGRGGLLRGSVLGYDTHLPAGSRAERRLVMAVKPGWMAGPRDSQVGDLVYRPLD